MVNITIRLYEIYLLKKRPSQMPLPVRYEILLHFNDENTHEKKLTTKKHMPKKRQLCLYHWPHRGEGIGFKDGFTEPKHWQVGEGRVFQDAGTSGPKLPLLQMRFRFRSVWRQMRTDFRTTSRASSAFWFAYMQVYPNRGLIFVLRATFENPCSVLQ